MSQTELKKVMDDFILDMMKNHTGLIDQAARFLIMAGTYPAYDVALEYSDDGKNIWLTVDGVRIFVANRSYDPDKFVFSFTGIWLGGWDHLNG